MATTIASLEYEEHGAANEVSGVRSLTCGASTLGRRLRSWSPALRADLILDAAAEAGIVHSHALWMMPKFTPARRRNSSADRW
ncbi:MAG: hypothetical protein R2862_00975 [Thermoanaerobaculia bacterium]